MDSKIKELVTWICENASSESGLLYIDPQWYVYTRPLLCQIVKMFSIDESEMIALVSSIESKLQ